MSAGDRNWDVVVPSAGEDTTAAREESLPEALDDAEDGESVGMWWAHLPDFIKRSYPFDLPPERLGFAQGIFTECGAPARCPQETCRRSMRCEGGDGPPCFRADRKPLQQMLFISWMVAMGPATVEEGSDLMKRWGNPYRWFFAEEAPTRGGRSRRRRRGSVVSARRSP